MSRCTLHSWRAHHYLAEMAPFNLLKLSIATNFLKNKCPPISRLCWTRSLSSSGNAIGSSDFDELDDENYMEDVLQYNQMPVGHRRVVVAFPRQRFGKDWESRERVRLLLDETVTLVKSVPDWNVVGTAYLGTSRLRSEKIFSSTNLQRLKNTVKETNANALVMALSELSPPQHHFLQNYLNIETYDRFTLILKVFKERAATKEAKLQLKLAELQYVKQNIGEMRESQFEGFAVAKHYGGRFDSNFFETKKRFIHEREHRIKALLEKSHQGHTMRTMRRKKAEVPTVAVVGYTNSGKTTLIKALTGDQNLQPEDKLFATLDVTCHLAQFSGFKVIFVDTIGFITDIPTSLIHSFRSTLSEISTADLLLHVIDASHIDREAQMQTVYKTLKEIKVPDKLINSMVEIYNKIDKVNEDDHPDISTSIISSNTLKLSATNGTGLDELCNLVQAQLIKNTERQTLIVRVPNGGEEYRWMYKQATVIECVPDEDANYMRIKVVITKAALAKFLKTFSQPEPA